MTSQGDWGMERVSSDPEACTSDLCMRNAPTHPLTPLTFSPSYYALVFLCLNPSAVYFLKHSVSLPPTHTHLHTSCCWQLGLSSCHQLQVAQRPHGCRAEGEQ